MAKGYYSVISFDDGKTRIVLQDNHNGTMLLSIVEGEDVKAAFAAEVSRMRNILGMFKRFADDTVIRP